MTTGTEEEPADRDMRLWGGIDATVTDLALHLLAREQDGDTATLGERIHDWLETFGTYDLARMVVLLLFEHADVTGRKLELLAQLDAVGAS